MSNLIQQIEQEQMQSKEIPHFSPGDTLRVHVKVKEGNRERLQPIEGVVIAKRNRGVNSSFTLRRIAFGQGVEYVFQTYSHRTEKITVKRRGRVRRAKLYYLRYLKGKKARIPEKISSLRKEKVKINSGPGQTQNGSQHKQGKTEPKNGGE